MSLTIQEVEHIASLARLELSDGEINHYREQLSAILDFVAQLQKLNTSSAHSEIESGIAAVDSSLRDDEAVPGLSPEILLATAADKERSQFKIPPVFE